MYNLSNNSVVTTRDTAVQTFDPNASNSPPLNSSVLKKTDEKVKEHQRTIRESLPDENKQATPLTLNNIENITPFYQNLFDYKKEDKNVFSTKGDFYEEDRSHFDAWKEYLEETGSELSHRVVANPLSLEISSGDIPTEMFFPSEQWQYYEHRREIPSRYIPEMLLPSEQWQYYNTGEQPTPRNITPRNSKELEEYRDKFAGPLIPKT